jgi:hypothetical protein
MADELKVYEGAEREQAFVKRYEPNPGRGTQTPRGGYDQRPYRTTKQWTYCIRRHHDYWRERGEKRARAIPDFRFEGEEGWWFPKLWIVEFAQTTRPRPHYQEATHEPATA